MPFIESHEEFHRRQGGDCLLIEGWYCYPNGALMEEGTYGARREPPADEHLRAKLILRFWEERHRRALDEFNHLKGNLKNAAEMAATRGHHPPPEAELKKLKQLREVVKTHQTQVDLARKEVERTVPEAVRRRQKMEAAARRSVEEFLGQLSNIKL